MKTKKRLDLFFILFIMTLIPITMLIIYYNNLNKTEDLSANSHIKIQSIEEKNAVPSNLDTSISDKYIEKKPEKKESKVDIKPSTIKDANFQIKNAKSKLETNESNLQNKKSEANNTNSEIKKNKTNSQNNELVDNKTFFSNSVFFGDSLTEGFSAYEVLNASNVVGIIGLSLMQSHTKIDKIINKNPKNIFIMLGTNDIEGNISKDVFINTYIKLIHKLKQNLPDSNIYVQSVFPVKNKVERKMPHLSNSRITEYNDAVKNMTQLEKVTYVNLIPLLKSSDKDFFEPDGIHVKYSFYSVWLNYLKNNYPQIYCNNTKHCGQLCY